MDAKVTQLVNEARGSLREVAGQVLADRHQDAFRATIAALDALTDAIDRLNAAAK